MFDLLAINPRSEKGYWSKTESRWNGLTKASRLEIHAALAERDGGDRCRYRGCYSQIEIDHIVSMRDGGTSAIDNLQLLCRACNARKANRSKSCRWALWPYVVGSGYRFPQRPPRTYTTIA
jgi:5-methylcytosine-specific restriction endonuclease McrA